MKKRMEKTEESVGKNIHWLTLNQALFLFQMPVVAVFAIGMNSA
jgi:hypothetical protein